MGYDFDGVTVLAADLFSLANAVVVGVIITAVVELCSIRLATHKMQNSLFSQSKY